MSIGDTIPSLKSTMNNGGHWQQQQQQTSHNNKSGDIFYFLNTKLKRKIITFKQGLSSSSSSFLIHFNVFLYTRTPLIKWRLSPSLCAAV